MTVNWFLESCDRRDDPVSGARIIQLTSGSGVSNNIYGEQPYCSPDGQRLVIARSQDFCFDEEGSLLVHELSSLRITMVVRRMRGVRGVFNAAWSGLVYYWTPDRRLMRLSLTTLEQEEVFRQENPEAPLPGGSVSPDQRYVIGQYVRITGPGAPIVQIVRLDLAKGTQEVIFEHPEIVNTHLQFNPVNGKQILVQHNRGSRLQPDGTVERLSDHTDSGPGTTLFAIDSDGSNLQRIPAGPPHTAPCTGHECFVADTGRVLFSAGWRAVDDYHLEHDRRHPNGNILTAAPGDKAPVTFHAPEHFFNHVSASRCGRYFLADSMQGGVFRNRELQATSLVVGCIETGKYQVLVQDTLSYAGGNQCTHTHPYLTADNRHVIFNANPCYSTPQVYAARIPEGFLQNLE